MFNTLTYLTLSAMMVFAPLASASPPSGGAERATWAEVGPGVQVRTLSDGSLEYRGEGVQAFNWLDLRLSSDLVEAKARLKVAKDALLREDLRLRVETLEEDLTYVAERLDALEDQGEAARDIEASYYDGSCHGSASVDFRTTCGGFATVSCSSKQNLYVSYYASSDVARAGASRPVYDFNLGLGASVSRNLSCYATALASSNWGFAMVTTP